MTEQRYDVPLDELERNVRTSAADQVETTAEPRLHDRQVLAVPPWDDGAPDADGD